jgi:hypothetical protein
MLIRAVAVAGGRVATCFKFCVLGGGVVEYKYWRKEYCRDVHGTMECIWCHQKGVLRGGEGGLMLELAARLLVSGAEKGMLIRRTAENER